MPMADTSRTLASVLEVLQKDGTLLDEGRFDQWLTLYTEDCEFWVPTWRSENTLTEDPRTELSHIYFSSRGGLEDRVRRVRSGQSPASTPMPRTSHIVGNVLFLEPPLPARVRVRASWHCDVFFVRDNSTRACFGRSELELVNVTGDWKIRRKKIVLLNDYVATMLDFYCL
jgi:3-phenylpropionate/cinnamic acid dioxygenase small subunit